MLKGTIALVIRYILIIAAGGLATAGVITSTADLGYYCFDSKVVAEAASAAIVYFIGGGGSLAAAVIWRKIVATKEGGKL